MAEIEASFSAQEGTLAEMLKPGLRMALVVAVMLSVFGQLSGVNIVVYYGPKILEAAGFGGVAALLGQVGFGLINLVATIAALFVVDRWGRRPLLIGGMAVVTVVLAIIGGLFLVGVSGVSIAGGEVQLAESISRPIAVSIAVMIGAYMAFIAVSICRRYLGAHAGDFSQSLPRAAGPQLPRSLTGGRIAWACTSFPGTSPASACTPRSSPLPASVSRLHCFSSGLCRRPKAGAWRR